MSIPTMPGYIDLLKPWLMSNGYEGLYCSSEQCGCAVGELKPCEMTWDEVEQECIPGYRVAPPKDAGEEYRDDFWIGPKPESRDEPQGGE